MNPMVSIIMPCYQNAKTVERTVDSVLAQTENSWELIAVNDGSKDNTGSVLDSISLRDPRIRVIHKENGGVSSARNVGMDVAQGEWLFFLDADDLLTEDALSHLLGMVTEERDVVCAAYQMIYIDEGNREETHTCADGDRQTVLESLIRGDSALNSMCARLYRRSVVEAHKIRAPLGVKVGEDVLFNLAFFAVARAYAMSDHVIYIYEFGGDSAMTRTRKAVYARNRDMLDGISDFIGKQGWQTWLFRAHIDVYLRILRADRGRFAAALAFDRKIVRRITQNVDVHALCAKQRLYYMALVICPFASILLP